MKWLSGDSQASDRRPNDIQKIMSEKAITKPYHHLPILTFSYAHGAKPFGVLGLVIRCITMAYQKLPNPTVSDPLGYNVSDLAPVISLVYRTTR